MFNSRIYLLDPLELQYKISMYKVVNGINNHVYVHVCQEEEEKGQKELQLPC